MTKQKTGLLLVAVIFGAMFFFTTMASAAQPIELSLGLIVPPKHLRYLHVIEPWMKMIDEQTKGAVKINPNFNMTLAPANQLFDATVKGLADISESYTFDPPGKFLMTNSLTMPETGFNTSISASRALWHIYKTIPQMKEEYKGAKVLWLHTTPAMKLMMKRKPVRSLEDLKGSRLPSRGMWE